MKNKLEELFVDKNTAEIMKSVSDHEARLIKLEKIIQGGWTKGYDAGVGAELNSIILLAEDRESEMTYTDFISYLKERRKKLLNQKLK